MRLLALDTSTDRPSIAAQCGSDSRMVELPAGPQSSRTLLPESLKLLGSMGMQLRELDALVYGCGPGAFTGLRTSCAAAQGLAWGADVAALPVDSLQAIAQTARQKHGVGRVVAVLDARMQEVYSANLVWRASSDGPQELGHWDRETPIQVLSPYQLKVPEAYAIAGNAFAAYPEAFSRLPSPHYELWPSAAAMLQLAPGLMAQGLLQTPAQIAPLYVRNKVALTIEERTQSKRAT